jgi:hypothetical protein
MHSNSKFQTTVPTGMVLCWRHFSEKPAAAWMPLVAAPAAIIAVRNSLESWVFMWLLAVSIFLGCKWLTWCHHLRRNHLPHFRESGPAVIRSMAYFFLWPGMDAEAFFNRPSERQIRGVEWVRTLIVAATGAALFWFAAAGSPAASPVARGWTGMIGLVLFVHFGVLHLLALGFNRAGIWARPLMCAPASAASLSDFWGSRWNTAFNALMRSFVFWPVWKRAGPVAATAAVFLVSGLIHDLVISLPAGGGFGKPTLYFLLQGAAVLLERSLLGIRLGLNRGWRGKMFFIAATVLPLPLLFHTKFVYNVVLPMLNAFGN